MKKDEAIYGNFVKEMANTFKDDLKTKNSRLYKGIIHMVENLATTVSQKQLIPRKELDVIIRDVGSAGMASDPLRMFSTIGIRIGGRYNRSIRGLIIRANFALLGARDQIDKHLVENQNQQKEIDKIWELTPRQFKKEQKVRKEAKEHYDRTND